jgi:RES domain-containing protein
MADQHFRGYVGLTYREVKEKYLDTAHKDFQQYLLDTLIGSMRAGNRFNPVGEFGAIYLSLDPETPFRELYRAYVRSAGTSNPEDIAAKRALLTVDVSLQQVVNLSDAAERKEWGVTPEHLTGEWASCQQLARSIYHSHEAIRYPSATGQGENLAIFYDRLVQGSYLHLVRSEVVTVSFDQFRLPS